MEFKNREELAASISGIAIELGVAAGDFSEVLLQNPKIVKVFSVDAWAGDTRIHTLDQYKAVLKRFKKYGKRSVVYRHFFETIVSQFNPIFDFIYIDGYAHTGQAGGKTLNDWWNLLKVGGVYAGHDYHPRWPLTMKAVDEFVKRYNLELHITGEKDEIEETNKGTSMEEFAKTGRSIPGKFIQFPSWYVYKK